MSVFTKKPCAPPVTKSGLMRDSRKLRRLARVRLFLFVLAAALFTWQTFEKAAINRQYQQAMNDFQHSVDVYQDAIEGLRAALSAEQAKAGRFEWERNRKKESLQLNKQYVDNLLTRIESLQEQLRQCAATNAMFSSDEWTGQAAINAGNSPTYQ
nr:hypothetical protein [uncultured Halomonas sp.]